MIIDQFDFIVRILVAGFLGGLIGLEREWSHKVAGLRTHTLVAIGAALISIISISAFPHEGPEIRYDPSRIISNIIVGIGFIGGGVILKAGFKVVGITTAATLWVVAAIGIAVGVGFVKEAIFVAAVVYFVLSILWFIERKMLKKPRLDAGEIREDLYE